MAFKDIFSVLWQVAVEVDFGTSGEFLEFLFGAKIFVGVVGEVGMEAAFGANADSLTAEHDIGDVLGNKFFQHDYIILCQAQNGKSGHGIMIVLCKKMCR